MNSLSCRNRSLTWDLLLGMAASCVAAPAAPTAPTAPTAPPPSLLPGFTVENYPRVDGSTSTIPVGQLLASRVAGLMGEWRRISQERYASATMTFSFPIATEQWQIDRYTALTRRNYHTGTPKAYLALASGHADVILVARPPSPDELKAASAKNVAFDVRHVAIDGLVIVANKANPVTSLTRDQLRNLFGGKIRLWRELGGKDFPVRLLTRDRNSGSEELLQALLMKGRPTASGDNATLVTEMGEVINRIAENPHAVGYSVYYYERFMASSPANKLIAVDGVLPTAATLADGSYRLAAPVEVVTRAGIPATSPAARLRDWLLSPDGQRLIRASGYVPITPTDAP